MWRSFQFGLVVALVLLAPFARAQDDESSEIEVSEPPGSNTAPKFKRVKFDEKATPEQRRKAAIERGIAWLRSQQAKDGSWGVHAQRDPYSPELSTGTRYRDELAPTIWVLYTLVRCGVPVRDPAVRNGWRYIRAETKHLWDVTGGNPPGAGRSNPQPGDARNPRFLSTYETAALVLLMTAMYPPEAGAAAPRTDNPNSRPAKSAMPKDVWRFLHGRMTYLLRGASGGGRNGRQPGLLQTGAGGRPAGWGYAPGGTVDISATHLAALAVRAAERSGYPTEQVAPGAWKTVSSGALAMQERDGGFRYPGRRVGTTSALTACGAAVLHLCREALRDSGQPVPPALDAGIDRSLAWIDGRFEAGANAGDDRHHYYGLWTVGTAGQLCNRPKFAGIEWRPRIEDLLVRAQCVEGYWMDPTETFRPNDLLSTTLALLLIHVN